MIDRKQLAALPLFEDLGPGALESVARSLQPFELPSDAVLVQEGQTVHPPLYVIVDGNVEVKQDDPNGQSRTLAIIESPTVIGELEFFAEVPCAATVVAHDDLIGFMLSRDQFDDMVNAGEPAAARIAVAVGKLLSQRLAETNRLLTRALGTDPQKAAKVQEAQATGEPGSLDELASFFDL